MKKITFFKIQLLKKAQTCASFFLMFWIEQSLSYPMNKKFSLGSAWNVSYRQLYENMIFTSFFCSKVV